MNAAKRSWGLPVFCMKFLVFVVALVILWWLFLPYYGLALVQCTGLPLRHLLGVPIEAVRVEPRGLLNTETTLVFVVNGMDKHMPVALLATNVPPYIALVLATAGLAWKRRLRIILYGCGILAIFHVLFIVIALRFQEALMRVSEIPTAVAQFFLTLPFMLWIVFAYWDRIMGAGQKSTAPAPAAPESKEDQTP